MSKSLRYISLLFLFVLSLGLKAQNPFGFDLEHNAAKVELAFKKESNLVIVPIKVNGVGPYNFIVDTGSESGLIFDKWLIGEGNLADARKIPVYSNKGEKVTDLLVANNLNINLDGVSGVQQTMLVLDEDVVDVKNVLGTNVHGVLGSEIFNRFVVEVDYANLQMTLHDPEKFKKPRGFKAIPIEIDGYRPYVRVDIRQKGHKPINVKLLVDSGASSALFLDEAHNEEIVLPQKTIEHTLGRGLAGIINGRIGRVKKLKMGNFRFNHITTSFPEDWGIGKRNESETDRSKIRYGTLGADILARFHVIYDYMNKTMYLKKNEEFGNYFVFNTTGLSVIAVGHELNEYLIVDVIEGSPADKVGLKVGDEIISLNGKPAFFHSLTEVNNMLRAKPGNILTVIVRRDEDLMKKVVRLKRLL